MSNEMEDVITVVKSCLLTSKHGASMSTLQKDYRTLEARNIPYQQMGFPTLEAFMRSIPGVRLTRRGSELWVEAIPSRESAHIARLVAGQRQAHNRSRRPKFRQVAPARRPRMAGNMRSCDMGDARNRSWNTGNANNRGSCNNMTPPPRLANQHPISLMEQSIRPPLMSLPVSPPSKPRYTAATQAQMASPSKRMIDRNILPQQHLDYERDSRAVTVAPVMTNKAPMRMTMTPEVPRQIKTEPPGGSLTPITPGSGVLRPGGKYTSRVGPSGVTSSPQSSVRTSLNDRLVISQSANQMNSSLINGNGRIQVTFSNVGAEGDGPLTPVSPTQDLRDELKKLVRELDLQEPVYKNRPVVGKNGVESGVYGQVLIGPTKFSSYPQEAKTEKEAEFLAARQAVAELTKERGSKLLLRETTDKKLIKERVLAIVDQHNGVFIHKIPAYYQELHKEILPDDWLEDVEKWSDVTMDNAIEKATILRRRRAASTDKVLGIPSPKADKVLLNPIGRVEPGMLELPDDNCWIACVTAVMSPVEIWVRLEDENYSEEFDKLTNEMLEHYTSTKYPVSETIEVGGYYALKGLDDYWHRVRVIEWDAVASEAEVSLIDIGTEETVNTDILVPLDKKFCLLSAQAIKVSLAGLEDFSDYMSALPRVEKILLDRIFYAEDLTRELNKDDGPVASVILYDTSGPDDINVNDYICKKIINRLIKNVPKLEEEGQVTEVHMSHAEPNGDVFVQVKYEGIKFLVQMLNKLTQYGLTDEDLKRSALKTVDPTKVYFARCPTTGDWYRVKIIGETNATPRALKVFLIDFGRTIIVDPKNVLNLEVLSQFLAKYPAQAMKVRLHNIELSMFDEKMVARLVELAPPSELLLLKVVKPSYRGSPSTVELFKRIQPENVLVAINNTLALEPQLSKANGDGNNNNVRPRKRVERTNSRMSGEPEEPLMPPQIPAIGNYFDVHVTMAANPGNFTIQPHNMTSELQAMMGKLQKVCAACVDPHPSLESVREGRLYAAKHVDGNWYRVCVSNVINEHMVTVYFCDYGDVTVTTLDKLCRLQKQFLDLPYQAIKAKLVGIRPRNMDWAVEDAVRFQDLVVERDFVSVVVESAPDKHSPGDTVLGLVLIDVSTKDDVNIGKLLVDEGRAMYID